MPIRSICWRLSLTARSIGAPAIRRPTGSVQARQRGVPAMTATSVYAPAAKTSMFIRWCASIETDCAMEREEAIVIYRAGQEPVVEKLCELSAKIDEQAKKIATLQKNSSTSSKPPSSDIIKPAKTKKGKGKKNKHGGQPGHPRHERTPFSEDEIHERWEYHCLSCPECDNIRGYVHTLACGDDCSGKHGVLDSAGDLPA